MPPSATAEALRGVRECYDEDWTVVVHSLKGDVLDLPPCAATESETEPAGQVSGAGQRHSDEEAVKCVAKVERLGPAAGFGSPRATGSWPRTLDELYASFAALMEEDLGGFFDMEREDLMKCAGRGESARFQEGTISASRRGMRARGSPQARTWHRIAALFWELLASWRRLRAPHLVSGELDVLARLQAKIGKLAAQDLVGDIGLNSLSLLVGCSFATTLLRVVLVEPLDAMLAAWQRAKFLADPCVPLVSKGRDAARLARRALERL
ncbi:unnamed protein product [Prorocentrum cordatum]|uniref:Rab3 GTPase-activating protein catalytic subunit n=1 Tax=Prorocentrum cordatum TaxID=2364126 RepID=A0ABN9V4A1_9DINO|nr:unnamed protein product [Polarella glacialis]